MGYFMHPFIDVDMNLTNQLENLATYSFLAAIMHIRHGTNCLTSALYADTQATVKNIIFTVVRMQKVDPERHSTFSLKAQIALKVFLVIVGLKIIPEILTLRNLDKSWVLPPLFIPLFSITQIWIWVIVIYL